MEPSVSTPLRPTPGPPTATRDRSLTTAVRRRRDRRFSLAVFLLAGLAMLVAVLVINRHQWFFNDDWDFIATRTIGNLNALFRPHYGHWSTTEVVVDRGLYEVFGLRTYVPYQLVMVCLHFAIAAMLRAIMLRSGVRVWIATAAALLFVFFGAGFEDIVWAGGMGYVAALAFGLAQLLLSDHDGPIDRRDWLGLAAGTLGLMSNGLMLIMMLVVGLNTLVRRGWRAAAFHVAPLVGLYLIWWYAIGRRYPIRSPSILQHLGLLPTWIGQEVSASFGAMGQVPGVGLALALLLVLGLPLAFVGSRWSTFRRRVAPLALLIGALTFVVANGWQRAVLYLGIGYARSSHYLDVVVAMVLPALALAAEAVVRRWRVLLPVVLAAFVIGIPGNLEKLDQHSGPYSAAFEENDRSYLTAVASLPIAREIPRTFQPDSWVAPGVTIGWLVEQETSGRIPREAPLAPRKAADLSLGLALHQSDSGAKTSSCQSLTTRVLLHLDAGRSLRFSGGDLDVTLVSAGGNSDPQIYIPAFGHSLKALAPLTVFISPHSPIGRVTLCS
jgi:hypothetical protein